MHAEDPGPPPEDVERATRALKAEPVAWRAVERGGQTAASRWIATLPDGATRFVKIAFTLDTAAWIRDEHLFYLQHKGLAFLPAMIGWDDDGECSPGTSPRTRRGPRSPRRRTSGRCS